MFGIFDLLTPPRRKHYPFPKEPKDWDPAKTKWEKGLYLTAKSFQPELLYEGQKKKGRFIYTNKLLPKGEPIEIYKGRREGGVKFDDDVKFPAIFENKVEQNNPWMSLTPNELMTLRSGTRRAKGHTVVAGLGLGYQLLEVMKRDKVKEVTLVEKEQDVVDLVLPKLEPKLPKKPLKIIVGDAYQEVPRLEADVALIDIFGTYGWNTFDYPCPGIPIIWCWGTRA